MRLRIWRAVALIVCAAVIAALVLHPGWLTKGVDRRFLTQWVKGEYLKYDGTLTIWHVASQACGTLDGTSYLKQRALEFEKKNFGIYFTLETLTPEELTQKLAAGERPDILSFNGGDIQNPQELFLELEISQTLLPGLEQAGVYNGKVLACPIFQTGYAVMVNEDQLYEMGFSPPTDLEAMDADWLSELPQASMAYDQDDCTTAGAAVFATLDETFQQALLETSQTCEAFFQGEGAPIMLASIQTVRNFKLLGEKTYAPTHSVYAVSGFSGRVQYAGVCVTEDVDKAQACAQFIGSLLSKTSQAKLESIWAVPVVDLGEKLPADTALAAIWMAAMDCQRTATPNAFQKVAFDELLQAPDSLENLRAKLLLYCNAEGKRVK